jgi:hypothetical protein
MEEKECSVAAPPRCEFSDMNLETIVLQMKTTPRQEAKK